MLGHVHIPPFVPPYGNIKHVVSVSGGKENGKPASDSPRYRALGNSMAVPVMRWIGERIALVEKHKKARRGTGLRRRIATRFNGAGDCSPE